MHYSIWWNSFFKIYLYVKDPNEAKYQYFIKNVKTGLELCKNPKDFIYYSDNMQDVHNNTDEYNPAKEQKVLIVLLIVFNSWCVY